MKRAVPRDYDRPERFRTARSVLRRHARRHDVHGAVARRLVAEELTPVLDVGCGDGELARHLPKDGWVGVDGSAAMVDAAPEPVLHAEATSLPFRDESFGSVALLYVLYHLPAPELALREARRVLRPGGLVAVAAPSRHDSPELAHALPRGRRTFDAEVAPLLLARHFDDVEVERWDAPLLDLPTAEAVRDYLVGKGAEPEGAHEAAAAAGVPLTVTKRGAIVFARNR